MTTLELPDHIARLIVLNANGTRKVLVQTLILLSDLDLLSIVDQI